MSDDETVSARSRAPRRPTGVRRSTGGDRTTASVPPRFALRWARTFLPAARVPGLDARPRNLLTGAVGVVCLGLALMLPALYVRRLAGGGSAVEGLVVVGVLTGNVLAFVLGREFARTRDAEGSTTESHALSKDAAFGVLKNSRRREALRYLRRAEGNASIGELAEHVAATENGVRTYELTSAQRKRVYTTLYQCHLPTMDDAGVVEYDRNRGTVELLDAASELFAYLDVSPDRETTP